MVNIAPFPLKRSVNVAGVRRIAYVSKDAGDIIDSMTFPTRKVHIGLTDKSLRYLGARPESSVYLGNIKLF